MGEHSLSYEINLSNMQYRWKIIRQFNYIPNKSDYLCGGDFIRLQHTEIQGYLTADLIDNDVDSVANSKQTVYLSSNKPNNDEFI